MPHTTYDPARDVDFAPVTITREEFLHPRSRECYGERVLWADGSVHGWPETNADTLVVLRRKGLTP